MTLNRLKAENERQILEAKDNSAGAPGAKDSATGTGTQFRASSKAQVAALLQKIFFFMQEKRYSKKQLRAVFDRNGNGILSREEFVEALKKLNLNIPIDKARMMLNFIDRNENGHVEIEELIRAVFDSVPQQFRNSQVHGATIRIFSNVVEKLGKDSRNFLQSLVQLEKIVRPKINGPPVFRLRVGIYALDF